MKVVQLHKEKERLSKNTIAYFGIAGFFIGVITAMIPIIDIFGTASIWVKDGWNAARVMLDCCCFISGGVCSFFSMYKTILY